MKNLKKQSPKSDKKYQKRNKKGSGLAIYVIAWRCCKPKDWLKEP